jgi:hypothetical protein
MRKIISNNTELTLEKDELGNLYLTGYSSLSKDDAQFKDLHNSLISDEVLVKVTWDDPNIGNAESNDDVDWNTYKVYINGEYTGNQDNFEIIGDYRW